MTLIQDRIRDSQLSMSHRDMIFHLIVFYIPEGNSFSLPVKDPGWKKNFETMSLLLSTAQTAPVYLRVEFDCNY